MKTCVDCGASLGHGTRFRCLRCWREYNRAGDRLTPTETQLYAALVGAVGDVLSYADLVRELEYCPVGKASDSLLIRTHIHNLRRKVGHGEIGSRRGQGYYWAAQRTAS